jgi:hypothetical protein
MFPGAAEDEVESGMREFGGFMLGFGNVPRGTFPMFMRIFAIFVVKFVDGLW